MTSTEIDLLHSTVPVAADNLPHMWKMYRACIVPMTFPDKHIWQSSCLSSMTEPSFPARSGGSRGQILLHLVLLCQNIPKHGQTCWLYAECTTIWMMFQSKKIKQIHFESEKFTLSDRKSRWETRRLCNNLQ